MADTTIQVKTNSLKIKIALGLGGLIALVIIAFLYRFEAGIIALAIGGATAVRVWAWALRHYKLSNLEQRRLEAEARTAEAQAVKAWVESHFFEANAGVFVLDGIVISSFYPAVPASKPLADVPMLAGPEKPSVRKLLSAEWVHMLIVGPTDVGKTTVANHLIDNAPNGTICLAIDPHGKFNVWPRRVAEVIGTGRNYGAIDKRLAALIGEMDRRYNSDDAHFQKILIVVDEWLSVLENCPSARRFFDTVGSESRKVNMSLVITTISATVDDLNCSAAVRDNLVQLTLNRTLKDQNLGELKWSRRDTELVELPGPYIDREPLRPEFIEGLRLEVAEVSQPLPIELDGGPVAWTPTATELRVYELYLQKVSLRGICQEIYGSIGGRQAEEVKEILAKFGVSL